MTIDSARIEAAVAELLEAIGEDPTRDGLVQTPRRVAEAAAELFAGVGRDAAEPLLAPAGFDGAAEPVGEFVALRGIAFRSVCEHHLLPFLGTAAIVFAPRDRIVGLGALAAVVELAAARPQLQERLSDEIAEAIERGLDARGVLVLLEASHGCVTARGPRQTGAITTTVAARGTLAEPAGRGEALALLTGSTS